MTTGVLGEILEHKKKEVAERKKRVPVKELLGHLNDSELRDFKGAISGRNKLALIAEIKRASPSEGVIRKDFDLEKIVDDYNFHARAISVLTDEKFFQGKIEYLREVKKLTKLPVLCKDFIIDKYQLFEARANGADAVLLIGLAAPKEKLRALYKAASALGMQCLVEAHCPADLRKVLSIKPSIVGINNRDLHSMKVDLGMTAKLVGGIPKGTVVVGESGYNSKKEIDAVRGKVDAVLVGSAFMKAQDIEAKIVQMGF
ncbi:MAG: indole-3-glycerol phosphate synthase TrpC [Candidatus Diapherotrites archaeon]|nr:indole-3-glycerol phosphate synthase TrpC [Candidatus Diapherotrites archaeon]